MLRAYAMGGRRRTLRQGVEVVAGLVHRNVAAVAEDDAVGRLAVTAAAHRAQRVVVLACTGVACTLASLLGFARAASFAATKHVDQQKVATELQQRCCVSHRKL